MPSWCLRQRWGQYRFINQLRARVCQTETEEGDSAPLQVDRRTAHLKGEWVKTVSYNCTCRWWKVLKSQFDLSSFHTPVVEVLQTLMAWCLMFADLLSKLLLQEHKWTHLGLQQEANWHCVFVCVCVQPDESSLDFSSCVLRHGIKNAKELACGVCLLNVEARSKVCLCSQTPTNVQVSAQNDFSFNHFPEQSRQRFGTPV